MTVGKSRKGFDLDLADGLAAEDSLAEILRAGGRYVEVKHDEKAIYTGNVAVEVETRDPRYWSGISATESDWWAVELAGLDTWVILRTDRLKALVKQAKQDKRRDRWGGDNNRFRNILVPVEWLVRPFMQERKAA
jgi:hypothetical protein